MIWTRGTKRKLVKEKSLSAPDRQVSQKKLVKFLLLITKRSRTVLADYKKLNE